MTDDNLLIYGHNMKYGEMFGPLDKYREKDYLRKHPIIELQPIWQDEPSEYVIVSLFDASMDRDHETYIKITEFNFETDEAKQQYIDAVCERSMYGIPLDVDAGDQLIMLVTCSYSNPNGRFLIVARELRENESADEMRALFGGK